MSTEILIIDDNADIRNIINDLIIEAGYKTRLAANYNQALNEIDKNSAFRNCYFSYLIFYIFNIIANSN